MSPVPTVALRLLVAVGRGFSVLLVFAVMLEFVFKGVVHLELLTADPVAGYGLTPG